MNTHQQPSKQWAMSQHDIYFNYNVVLPRHVFEEIVDKLLTSHSQAIREMVNKNYWQSDDYPPHQRALVQDHNIALDDILALLTDEV